MTARIFPIFSRRARCLFDIAQDVADVAVDTELWALDVTPDHDRAVVAARLAGFIARLQALLAEIDGGDR
jgi:hypothetical protein